MVCAVIEHGFVCFGNQFRLRLLDGRYVYMGWHSYCGPDIYYDKNEQRPIERWWEDEMICEAIAWFQGRGKKA